MRISYIVWMLFLTIGSYQDIRRKEISGKLLIMMGVSGTIIQIFEKSVSPGSWFLGVILGIVLLFLGFMTRESIGYGDGWLVLVMGMSLGFGFSFFSFLLGLGVSALVSGWLLMYKRVKRKYRIPFAPFLWIGCLMCLPVYQL